MKRILTGLLLFGIPFAVTVLEGNAGEWDLSGDSWVSPSKRVTEEAPALQAIDRAQRQSRRRPPQEPAHHVGAQGGAGFNKAIEVGDVRYSLQGLNNDTDMLLTLRNLTARDISLVIPLGIVFLPARSSVQRMLVCRSVPFAIPAGKSVAQRIPVLCMDIAKSPPSTRDTVWSHSLDADRSRLVAYVQQRAAKEAARRTDATQEQIERFFLRFVLWRYNGAAREDFVSFIEKYGSPAEKGTAATRSGELIQMADTIIDGFRRTRKEGDH